MEKANLMMHHVIRDVERNGGAEVQLGRPQPPYKESIVAE